MSAASFADLSRDRVERFLQTVLVIDNELTLETVVDLPLPEVFDPPVSLKGTTRIPPAAVAEPPAPMAPGTSPLDAKQIMDAFLKRSMICGMHKPNSGDELVAEAIQAARRSDAVIIDWMLERSDPKAAKEIIAGILDGDAAENGRLRLIAIYTSEPNIAGVAQQIREHLKGHPFTDETAGVLTKANTRIVVLNKEETPGALAPVKIVDLPTRIVEEFAHLSSGILSTFAVSAIAAVRRETHHVLAIFSKELDGAFLGHMCALQTPEDAKEFALDLLAGELRSVASMNPETGDVLAAGNLALQIDTLEKDGHLSVRDTRLPLAVARELPAKGLQGVIESRSRQIGPDSNNVAKAKAIDGSNVGFLFDDDDAAAERAHRRFARFASFQTEPSGRTILPKNWAPVLSLGSIVVRLAADGSVDNHGYLLCTQPRCDAVRGPQVRGFPFQRASVTTGAPFDLVAIVPGDDGRLQDVLLVVSPKPYDGRMIDFCAGADGRVRAMKRDDGRFEFKDTLGVTYVWIGDLRDLGAQRVASRVAARLHEVGLDEFEWLRLKAR